MRGPAPEGVLREALRNGTQLAVLSALALAQPLFDILGRNPTFFAVRRSTSAEIVLFALALVLGPPVVLTLIELAAATANRAAARALQLLFVGGFIALLSLSVLTKTDALAGAAAIVAAVAVGAAAAIVYRRTSAARTFLTVLAPAPLVFVALFLFHSPVSKLVFADEPEVRAATVRARTPVVMIVFDEFNTASLMDERGRINAERYPNFAALARDSIWFVNSTTMSWVSELAVPSLLSGRRPQPGKLPVLSEHPNNLFTLLGGNYRIRAIETLTNLCPRSLCRDTRPAGTEAVGGAYGSLASDVGIVYLHLLLPKPYVDRVPPVDESWGDFGRGESAEAVAEEIRPCARNMCRFADLLSSDRRPALYFVDALLPHTPYLYLPSGRQYTVDPRLLRGLEGGLWGPDPWPVLQGEQRYLLQLGYTDRALGLVLARLRATRLYDRALVIVTADHGVSFRANGRRRLPTESNLEDIAFVPLFVKLPGQKQGRVDPSLARTIDVLPTIARVLGISIPWRVDGRLLVGAALPREGAVEVVTNVRTLTMPLSTLRVRRARDVVRRIAVFGSGDFSSLYRIGPSKHLLGKRVATVSKRPRFATKVALDDRSLLEAVDPASALIPSFIEGKLSGKIAPREELAVAVNGTIAAVTRAFSQHGETRFSALVPEDALRAGRNDVAVYAVRGRTLEELQSSDLLLTLRERDGREVIESSVGRTIRVVARAVSGTIRVSTSSSGYVFEGTARRRGARPDALAVFVDDRAVYRGRAGDLRPQGILGQRELGKYGFVFELPRALLPKPDAPQRVRVLAIAGAVASELRYAGPYPWRR